MKEETPVAAPTQPSPSLSLISNGASAWFSVPDKISTGAPLPVVSRGRCSSGASVPGGVRRSCGAVAGSWWRGGSEPRVGRPEAKPRPRHCKGSYREHLREQHGTLPRHGEARTAWHGIVSSRAGHKVQAKSTPGIPAALLGPAAALAMVGVRAVPLVLEVVGQRRRRAKALVADRAGGGWRFILHLHLLLLLPRVRMAAWPFPGGVAERGNTARLGKRMGVHVNS